TPVTMLGLTMPALSFALSVGLVLNGLSRPFFGWVSDRIGRENTMFIAFLLEGIGISALLLCAGNPMAFVLSSGLVDLAWGQIFALFPATCTDLYGRKFATANYGMLYTAKGTAALLVPLANVLAAATGSWTAVFVVASVLNVVAATLALVALKPMRQRAMAEGSWTAPPGNTRCAAASPGRRWVPPPTQPDTRGPGPSPPPAADNRGNARQTSLAGEPRPRARGDETRPRAQRTAPARTTRRTSTPSPA